MYCCYINNRVEEYGHTFEARKIIDDIVIDKSKLFIADNSISSRLSVG